MADPLRTLYQRFDPEGEPADPTWRADRSRSPARDILERLELDFGSGKFLVVGTVGSGKSTELARLADERGRKTFVVRLDLVQHFDRVVNDPAALQRIKSWEVVFLVALAVVRAAHDRLGFDFVKDSLPELQRAWDAAAGSSEVADASEASVDVWKLAQSMVLVASSIGGPGVVGAAGAGMVALNAVADVKWRLPIGKARRALADQDEAVQSVLAATNTVLSQLRHRMGQPVLVALDGLDRIEARESVRALFIDSAILSHLDCHSVICGPFALRHDNDLVRVKGFDVKVLVNEPVLDKAAPRTTRGDGIAFLERVYAARTRDLPADLVPTELISDLAYYSGGSARDFVKLVRDAAAQAAIARVERVSRAHLDAALREQRLLLEAGLNTGSIAVLQSVMDDPQHRLPDDRHVPELLHSRKLLPYPDGSEWFFPHPLLLLGQLLAPI